jgi:hypothetical protein
VAGFCKKQGYQLWMDLLVAAEGSTKETAYQISIYRSIITWEMNVFEASEKTLKICSQFLYLGGFSCAVQAFKDYKHDVWF